MKRLCIIVLFNLIADFTWANNFVVTNTNDAGTGTLRAALTNANATPAASHTISFNIPTTDGAYNATTGVWTITPLSTMPYITRGNITIDGNTQTVAHGNTNPNGPEIMLKGSGTVDFAFSVFNVSGIVINGFIISNFIYGIQVSGLLARNNTITGNYIGTNYNASDTLGNYIGIEILGGPKHTLIGGSTPALRNIVSGNNHIGIRLANSDSNVLIGNYVGVDRSGTIALRNFDGISIEGTSKYNIIGSFSTTGRNLVSGNVAYGIPVFGAGCNNNTIIGNYIGTDISGSLAIPNTYGVLFDDGACYNILGGHQTGAANLISGNSGYGVFIYNNSTNSDTVLGNLIGTKANGTQALPNANGVVIDGMPKYHIVDSNVISGNLQQGMVIHATGTDYNVITRNRIGTDWSGLIAIPNQIDGIRIGEGPQHNLIGGAIAKGNSIANNGGNGITIMNNGDYYNKISANSIFNNAQLGIDLYPAGPTPNDAGDVDTGPNFGMNFPVITQAAYNSLSGNFTIAGTIDTPNPTTVTIELFKSDNDPSGYGQGERYLTSVTPDVSGNFNAVVVAGVWGGDRITATATDANGNTSEFSASMVITGIQNNINPLSKIQIHPNPAKDYLYLTIDNLNQEITISVVDILGQVVNNLRIIPDKQTPTQTINVENLKQGIYFIRIRCGQITTTKKIVIN
ncbi:MAG: T9SS type A sorting domain-containing protein [Bacteroidota bacterium]